MKDEERRKRQSAQFKIVDYGGDDEEVPEVNVEDDFVPVSDGNHENSKTPTNISVDDKVKKRKRKLFSPLPAESSSKVHVRLSQKIVRNDVYEAFAELDGHGFSYRESQIAMSVVSRLFGCNWKVPEEKDRDRNNDDEDIDEDYSFDLDTLPTRKAIRCTLKKMEAYSLKLEGEKLVECKESEDVVTHSTDSTTRKKVGCFAPQGLHINRDAFLPLPTLNIASVTTENVAESIKTDFDILSAASGHSAKDLYACVDVHMTDGTAHNKGISSELAKKLDREKEAGQLFCNPHTALGFDRGMQSVVNRIETKMGMEKIFQGFILEVDIDQKSDTVSLTAVSWALSLFGPDTIQKSWNYNKDFTNWLKRKGKTVHLFMMKDYRFGLLSKSCAIMCYHWQDFVDFLDVHDYVTNKLACLVRDGMSNGYVKIVISVIAAFGPHLIQPFYMKTKGKSTHSQLYTFFVTLYTSLCTKSIDASFFDFREPFFDGISKILFEGAKEDSGSDVIASVIQFSQANLNECIELAGVIAIRMGDVLASQRGKFYEFGGEKPEFPVFEQSPNIDNTITNNLQMERACGDHDNRFKKKCNVPAVSRGTILKYTTGLRNADDEKGGFRKMTGVVKIIEEIRANWNTRQNRLAEEGLSAKEAQSLHVENRKLNILESLKEQGGPFTNSEEVDLYLSSDLIDLDTKSKRMKNEVVYARDTSKSLPRSSPLFRIMKTDVNKKRRQLSSDEFGENLKTPLGKVSERRTVSIQDFKLALWNYSDD